MTVIGLTGSFGTGKTTAASLFKVLGATVIDADSLARRSLKKNSSTYKKIIGAFGEHVLDKGRNIDRRKLADIVFRDKSKLSRLNRIVHPEVTRQIKKGLIKLKRQDVVIIDAPLLVEANLTGLVDKLIVVKASRRTQLKRCMKKFGIGRKDVLIRITNQIPLKKKERMADYVIDNDGAKSNTRKQVEEIWREILWR